MSKKLDQINLKAEATKGLVNTPDLEIVKQAFLSELTELTRKYGLQIWGCGCCGSPSLDPIRSEWVDKYIISDTTDHIELVVKRPEGGESDAGQHRSEG